MIVKSDVEGGCKQTDIQSRCRRGKMLEESIEEERY